MKKKEKDFLLRKIKDAVITVSENFNNSKKKAKRETGK